MTKKIMLIFPKTPFRETCSQFLADMGYKVNIVDDPNIAYAAANRFNPDLILCYEDFHGKTGIEIADLMKTSEILSKIPFIIMSPRAEKENDTFQDMVMTKASDLIRLPVEQAKLYGFVSNWLESDNPTPVTTPNVRLINDNEKSNLKPKDETTSNKGSVSLYSMGRLFFNLINSKKTGTLLLKGDRRKMKVFIESGNVIEVQSNYMREDTLGKFLIGLNKLSEEQNQKSLEFARHNNVPQGLAIVRLGFIKEDQIGRYITEHKILKLLNVFQRRWYKSKFVFNEGALNCKDTQFRPTPLNKIVGTGIFNVARKKDIYETFFQKDKEKIKLQLSNHFDTLAADLDLGPALVEQAMRINGLSIEEIKSNREDQFENNLRLAFLMVVSQGMTFTA